MLGYSFKALAGTMPTQVSVSILFVCACALLCDIAAREREGEAWQRQVLHLIPALFAVCAVAGLTAQGSTVAGRAPHCTGGVPRGIYPHADLVRDRADAGICRIAVASARDERASPTQRCLFVAAKLFFEDLRHGHMGFIAGSIFLFALTLIGVPRLAKVGHRT